MRVVFLSIAIFTGNVCFANDTPWLEQTLPPVETLKLDEETTDKAVSYTHLTLPTNREV